MSRSHISPGRHNTESGSYRGWGAYGHQFLLGMGKDNLPVLYLDQQQDPPAEGIVSELSGGDPYCFGERSRSEAEGSETLSGQGVEGLRP